MKTSEQIILFLLLLMPVIGIAETKEIPFAMDDRDRIIRTEQKVEALNAKIDNKVDGLRNEVNAKFDGLRSEMNTRFDQLFSFLWAIIGIFTTMMVSVFGFAFWDRKLSLAPMKRENQKTLNALRDFAEHQPKLREILKNAGLL
jgi:predicted PurR-regulated permease PerM